jgi:hypothetical protein
MGELAPGSDSANMLMHKVYNDIALDRRRVKCLLSTAGTEIAKEVEVRLEAVRDEAYGADYFFDDATSTMYAPVGITTEQLPFDYDYAPEPTQTVEDKPVYTHTPDYMCCGIGFSGKKYEPIIEECCEDGSVESYLEDGSSGCI